MYSAIDKQWNTLLYSVLGVPVLGYCYRNSSRTGNEWLTFLFQYRSDYSHNLQSTKIYSFKNFQHSMIDRTMSNDTDSFRNSSIATSPFGKATTSNVTTVASAGTSNGLYKLHYGQNIIPTKYNNNMHNRRYSKSTIYINIVLTFIAFSILIRVFDPEIHNPILENDVLHQHIRNERPPESVLDETDHQSSSSSSSSSSTSHLQNDRIISLLKDAGIFDELSDAQRKHIPRWDQV
jgi:hypothetical protein